VRGWTLRKKEKRKKTKIIPGTQPKARMAQTPQAGTAGSENGLGSTAWTGPKNGGVKTVGLGILEITSAKQCPQVWPWFGRSLFSTDFVEFDQAV